MVNKLKAAGHAAIAHDELFAQNEKDLVWLKQVAKKGYIILSYDEQLRTNILEREAIRNSKGSVFVLVSKRLNGDAMAAAFVKVAPAAQKVPLMEIRSIDLHTFTVRDQPYSVPALKRENRPCQ
ncbi:MAG: hypothetical protein M3R08_05385 [Bacteroidota bacterium]|nr:hypothetical protein [Bacteroidota bacterium]